VSAESDLIPSIARRHPAWLETASLTLLAMVAFASNSILTRMALGPQLIDAATFTLVRLFAGALVLGLLARLQTGNWSWFVGNGVSGPLALFGYAAPFSFAYLRIGAAAGALVLFCAVQLTMVAWGIVRGERPRIRGWAGLALALGGFMALTLPSVGRPDPLGVALMAVAGVAWGAYSLGGKHARDPLAANASNFLWSLPLAAVLFLLFPVTIAGSNGLALAITSGALTSGVGYAIWYRALRGLTSIRAAVVQLSVPVLAGLGATVLLDERLNSTFLISGLCILGGIALVLSERVLRTGGAPTRS